MTVDAPELTVAARTDRGHFREANEDALLAVDPCFLVADGMGGHDHGAAASATAIAVFRECFAAGTEATVAAVESALDEARARVRSIAASSERGAGCTLTGAVRVRHRGEPCWYVLNIGDSRVYLQRGSRLEQLTTDHSLRSELLAEGDTSGASMPRNIITRALGSEDDRHDAWLMPIETGARLLVCSDGLTIELDDEVLRAVLSAGGRAQSVADELVRLALEAGGGDNISLVLVDVVAGGITPDDDAGDDETATTLEITLPARRLGESAP